MSYCKQATNSVGIREHIDLGTYSISGMSKEKFPLATILNMYIFLIIYTYTQFHINFYIRCLFVAALTVAPMLSLAQIAFDSSD